MNKISRFPVLIVLAAVLGLAEASAGGSDAFALDWATDLSVGLSSAAAFGAGQLVPDPVSGVPYGWFDEAWGLDYNHDAAKVSDLTLAASVILFPALVDRWDLRSVSTVSVMALESALLASGAKDLIKAAARRPRPYTAFPGGAGSGQDPADRYVSFPSGHATMAFTAAAFSATVFARGSSDEVWKWGVGTGAFALAGTTAVLRVLAGEHHVTDVAAGAALGTLIGAAIPWIHDQGPSGLPAAAGYRGLVMAWSY